MTTVVESATQQTEKRQTGKKPAAGADKICWLEVKHYPYQPTHQVELMHLQAEADALLIKLQTEKSRIENDQTR